MRYAGYWGPSQCEEMFKCFSTLCVSPIQVERGHIGVVRKENFEAATKRGAIPIFSLLSP